VQVHRSQTVGVLTLRVVEDPAQNGAELGVTIVVQNVVVVGEVEASSPGVVRDPDLQGRRASFQVVRAKVTRCVHLEVVHDPAGWA
jgi:hypothetical protein